MKKSLAVMCAAAATLAITGCSVGGSGDSGDSSKTQTVTLVTHDAFAVPKGFWTDFEKKNHLKVKVVSQTAGGDLVNQLVLSKDNPTGDAVYGIDNTFASRALTEGVLQPYAPKNLGKEFAGYRVQGDKDRLTPIDHSGVCVNADTAFFASKGLAAPASFDDLLKPEYKNLLVTPSATSSTGFAFLLATISAKGDGWQDYWKSLTANGLKVDPGWNEAYNQDFSQGEGKGQYPLVVSYDTSPAFTVNDAKTESTTTALLDTCSSQVEYAGVLKGAKHKAAAQKVVDYLTQEKFQSILPTSMYVYPVNSSVKLPEEWTKFAKPVSKPHAVPPAEIDKNRQTWQQQWSTVTGAQ